jgi:hypothetical protein
VYKMLKKSFVPVIIFVRYEPRYFFDDVSYTPSTPDFSVAEHYGLRNTTCLYSKDVASVYQGCYFCYIANI